MRKIGRFTCGVWLAAALFGGVNSHATETYPSKPIRIVVPFSAGGPGDILARLVAAQLPAELGQTVIVDNRPGANGEIGTEQVARAEPDGYTVLQVSTVQVISMALQPTLRYDLLRDFEPVSYAVESPLVLLTGTETAQKTVAGLIEYAKQKPDGLTYGAGGVGTVGHLSSELFKRAAGIPAIGVPYKGNGAAMGDLIGGRLDFYFATVAESSANIKAGRLNALAVTSSVRDPRIPEIPTMAEVGFPNVNGLVSWGFMLPKNTPQPIVKRLSDAITASIDSPSFQKQLDTLGLTANVGGPEVLASAIRKDYSLWRNVITEANIQRD